MFTVKTMKTFLKDAVEKEKAGLISVGEGLWIGTKKEWDNVVEEHEEDYKKVLAEVNFETGNVEFHDAGNYMEVPISVIQEVNKIIEIK